MERGGKDCGSELEKSLGPRGGEAKAREVRFWRSACGLVSGGSQVSDALLEKDRGGLVNERIGGKLHGSRSEPRGLAPTLRQDFSGLKAKALIGAAGARAKDALDESCGGCGVHRKKC